MLSVCVLPFLEDVSFAVLSVCVTPVFWQKTGVTFLFAFVALSSDEGADLVTELIGGYLIWISLFHPKTQTGAVSSP